jgi:hypothetical protein
MHTREKLNWAIENSVHWYDALCEAHAVPGEHHPAFWINRSTLPPYMSNLITLTDEADAEAQFVAIRSLSEGACGVKDSFRCLRLAEIGLHVLFHATWIFRSANSRAPKPDSDLSWRVVRGPTELQAWERTWRGVEGNAEARAYTEVFRPSLLLNPDFRFLLGERGGVDVATAALNRSSHAVGLSNVFSATEEPLQLFPGCVRLAGSIFPGLPLVGYERDAHLIAATAAGFEAVRGLTVWVRAPAERASETIGSGT